MIWRSQSPPATGRDADAATRSMVTPPGVARQIAGHAVVRELKRGGLGVVYLARHLLLGELRAIKRPLDHPDLNRASILARFRREIQAVGALRHDHIIRAHDAGIDADGPYLVMEYLEGCSVSDLLAHQGALPVAAACELVRQAATGLQAAHEARLIHRDLKPSNLMLARTPSGPRVVIIDWGLVKTVSTPDALTGPAGEELTLLGTSLGTPGYMSPEQARGATDLTIRSDLYSLGITLLCLLSGQSSPLRHGEPVGAWWSAVRQQRTDLPAGLIAVLDKVLAADPGQRLGTPREFAMALLPFCGPKARNSLAALLATVPSESTGPATGQADAGASVPIAGGGATAHPATVSETSLLPWSKWVPWPATARQLIPWLMALLVGCLGLGGSLAVAHRLVRGVVDDGSWQYDERFRELTDGGLPLGWQGAAFGMQIDPAGAPSLVVRATAGNHRLQLPSPPPRADFALDLAYRLHGHDGSGYSGVPEEQRLIVLLRSTNGQEWRVVFRPFGEVRIADQQARACRSVRSGMPVEARIMRRGSILTVWLQDHLLGAARLSTDCALQDLELEMTAGPVTRTKSDDARLYNVRLQAPPALTTPRGKRSSDLWLEEEFAAVPPGDLPANWQGEDWAVLQDADRRSCLVVTAAEGEREVTLPPLDVRSPWFVDVECRLYGHTGVTSGLRQRLALRCDGAGASSLQTAVTCDGRLAMDGGPGRQAEALRPGELLRVRWEFTGSALRVLFNGREVGREVRDRWPTVERLRIGLTAGTVPDTPYETARIYRVAAGPIE